MAIPTRMVGVDNREVFVDGNGAARVAQGDYDLTSFNELDVVNTGYNFYKPITGKQFVITGILCFADRDISDASDTVITIYEATNAETATSSKILLQFGMGRLTLLPFPTVRILVNPKVWINAKTDDDDIHLNIIGHYINTVQDPVE